MAQLKNLRVTMTGLQSGSSGNCVHGVVGETEDGACLVHCAMFVDNSPHSPDSGMSGKRGDLARFSADLLLARIIREMDQGIFHDCEWSPIQGSVLTTVGADGKVVSSELCVGIFVCPPFSQNKE